MGLGRMLRQGARRVLPARAHEALRRAACRVRHYGRACRCPVCNARLRAFLPHRSADGVVRPGAVCPVCGACERHRQFWKFVEDFGLLRGGPLTVVHIAPEPGLRALLSRRAGVTYIAGSPVPAPGDRALDLTRLALPPDSVDLLYAGHVLNMIADERAAIRETYRVLRPGGLAVLQVPLFIETSVDDRGADPAVRLRLFGDPAMHHRFGRDLFDRFREAGFEVLAVPYAVLLPAAVRARFGFERQDIVVCRKA